MTDATVIPLKIWQDPQGEVVLHYSERECSVFFLCWQNSGEPADYIGHLSFDHAHAVRSYSREFLPYRLPAHKHHSYILSISDSELVREHTEYRKSRYPQWPSRTTPIHFVVVGHDIYHEILADGYSATTIKKDELTDSMLIKQLGS